jgi:hypothetical protein
LTFWAKSRTLILEETEVFMPDFAGALGASKAAASLLILIIPTITLKSASPWKKFRRHGNRKAEKGVNDYGKEP